MPEACEGGLIKSFGLSVGLRAVCSCCQVFDALIFANTGLKIAYKFHSIICQQIIGDAKWDDSMIEKDAHHVRS